METNSLGKLVCIAAPAAWLAASLTLSCDLGQRDESWAVVDTDSYLGHEHGEDEYGEYFAIYQGLVACKDGRKVVFVYARWPDNLGQIVPGDRVHILADLAKLEKNRWGYSLTEVELSVLPRKSEF
jgi:hypothetical protein